MRYITMFSIIFLAGVFLAGCASVPQCPDIQCPGVNGIVYSPYTDKAIVIERGFFNPGTFQTEEAFDEKARIWKERWKEYEEQMKRQSGS